MPRRAALWLLALLVLALHLALVQRYGPARLGDGDRDAPPRRLAVQFTRALQPSEPPPAAVHGAAPRAAAAPGARRLTSRLAAAEGAASAAQVAEGGPVERSADLPGLPPTAEHGLAVPLSLAAMASSPALAAPAVAAAAPASAAAPAFEWPPSTRLRYRLTGNYRGPVEGQAQVEWLRSGRRYQVFMELGVGPPFAPLISRRVSSEGELTELGLRPSRYDEVTKVLLAAPRVVKVEMGDQQVKLADGSLRLRPPGLQDSASQFVHLTWLFTTQPELLQRGRSIELPLALPRRVEPWTYDVVGEEVLDTLAGPVRAFHVKPRREPKPGQDLTAEIWVAPSLQYLPVRILIRQDADTHIDLTIDRLPEQAAPAR